LRNPGISWNANGADGMAAASNACSGCGDENRTAVIETL
jgi:hypothetical protein